MSMARELIAAIIAAEKNLDEQIMRLHSYSEKNNQLMRQIDQELDGSSHSSSRNMKDQLSKTQEQLKTTVSRLQEAKTKLQRVRTI